VISSSDSITPASRISPVFVELRPVLVQAPVARELGLQDTQVVQATVESRQGQLKLVLDGKTLNAPLAGFLKEGDKVAFKTQIGANGQVSLAFMSVIPPAQTMLQERMQLPTVVNTLLHLPATFINWMRLVSPGVLQSMLPALSAMLSQSMAGNQLSMANLKPQTLKDWVMKGTRSTESALIKGESVDGDLKVLLRSLLASDDDGSSSGHSQQQDDPREILHQAINEIESSQLKAVQDWQQGDVNISLVIPFKDAHPVQVQFEKRRNKPGQPPNPFVVNMHTDSPDLGEVWLKSCVAGGKHQIDLTMWAVRSDTAQKAMLNASELTYEIESAGLRMGSFQVFNAPRPAVQVTTDEPNAGSVIDTKV
jgi:hypothetical protein